ncbi:hypothetical protein IFM89_010824 [Coptis chinensis]|uniref:Hexosyltransferase n=1 Tax=Coptis chinensis TaxID=261450 RepID=A0A835LXJ3_9MAGN|nr:hypothetical protein IFM89_010824 [Coptis chinensis]
MLMVLIKLQLPKNAKRFMNLFAIAVGIKQKKNVNKMVKKFPSSDFVIMVFHYDGVVDEWNDLEWNHRAIHISAINQTKWWFAKLFLHPDMVAEYNYVFIWDEDILVDELAEWLCALLGYDSVDLGIGNFYRP